jgi:protocatechuate 3,4-dioxygenase beta subunit
MKPARPFARRRLIGAGLGLTAALSVGAKAGAARLIVTPRQSLGPFYPLEIPLDSNNDLARVEGRPAPATGRIAHVFGQVTDRNAVPLRDLRVEIWQCDAAGYYHHPHDRGGRADPNFQGYGRTVTDGDGGYRFRTIEPVPYPGRTPHIHFAISGPGIEPLITQMYLRDHPLNARDGLFNGVRDPQARESLTVAFAPAPEIEPDALAGSFNIVIGATAAVE